MPDGAGIRPCVARRPWLPLLRDGDLIPCSITHAFLAFLPRIVALPVLKSHPPLMCVVLVPRMGGWGTKIFQELHWDTKPGFLLPLRGEAEVLKASAMMTHTGGVGA